MLRRSIENNMRSEDIGFFPHIVLLVISYIYGFAVRLRNSLYTSGMIKPFRLDSRVVSIGNITVGGTGKTPMTVFIAELLKARGKRVVILSRGYKGGSKGVAVVSDGNDIFLGPDQAGDEPYLMAERLKGVPVVVGADRIKSGLLAVKKFSPDFIILDDGFQHIRLARDLNILLVDANEGFGNWYLLPRGILREPVEGIGRADLALVKGGDLRGRDSNTLKGSGIPVFGFTYAPVRVLSLNDDTDKGIGFLKGKKALAVAGIANPESFFRLLEGLGVIIAKRLTYLDHHSYTQEDIEMIKDSSREAQIIITTEKDGVKLKGLSIYALVVDAIIDDRPGFEKVFYSLLKEAF